MIAKSNHNIPHTTDSASLAVLEGQSTEQRLVMIAFVVSLICHAVAFSVLLYAQTHRAKQRPAPIVMNVSLVSLPEYAGPSKQASKPSVSSSKNVTDKPASIQKKSAVLKKSTPKTIKKKTSLKKKTYRSEKVKKSTLKKLEKKVETSATDQIAKAIDKIKAKVGSDRPDKPSKEITPKMPISSSPGGDAQASGGKLAEIIDIYRVEIAYQVQRNWAFPEQLADGRTDLQTLLVFKVMPGGEIKDLFFTDRSGNSHFDESAYRAVMKSDPVIPHPRSISKPYVQMGLRFTPEGIQ